MILESEQYKVDSELQKLPTLDILLAFEDYSRLREREYEEQTRRAQVEKTRKERKAREAFKVDPSLTSTGLLLNNPYRAYCRDSSAQERLRPGPNGKKSIHPSRTMNGTSICSAILVQTPSNYSGILLMRLTKN